MSVRKKKQIPSNECDPSLFSCLDLDWRGKKWNNLEEKWEIAQSMTCTENFDQKTVLKHAKFKTKLDLYDAYVRLTIGDQAPNAWYCK